MAAGLLARNAREKGLKAKPWVKTSLAPGSRVVTDYLEKSEAAGRPRRHQVSTRSATAARPASATRARCCPKSPTPSRKATSSPAQRAVRQPQLRRPHPSARAHELPGVTAASRGLRAGRQSRRQPVRGSARRGPDGKPVFMKDIWPSQREIMDFVGANIDSNMFKSSYDSVFDGDANWNGLDVPTGEIYTWDADSTYVKNPPYFEGMSAEPAPVENIAGARVLALLGDSVTTDHISPAGSIKRSTAPRRTTSRHRASSRSRLQLLRLAPRQPRGHDARHLCQHSPAQPACTRHRRRLDETPAERRQATRSASKPWSASTRPRNATITKTAVSCTTCFGNSPLENSGPAGLIRGRPAPRAH